LVVHGPVRVPEVIELPEMVEHFQLVRWLEQKLMIMLPVHVDQLLGHRFQHRERDRVTIERDGASAASVKPAGDQQFAAVVGDGMSVACSIFRSISLLVTSKTPLTRPSSTPGRSISAADRRPSSTSIAPMTSDLPAPGRAGKAVQPGRQFDAGVVITAKLECEVREASAVEITGVGLAASGAAR